jgi:hypothetical protein
METSVTASRRVVSTLLMALLLATAGSVLTAGAARAAVHPITAGSAPNPGTPVGSVGVLGEHFVKFCVKNFKPNSTVKVVNETTGATVTLHTNSKGKGCTQVPIKRGCKAITQKIVATGTGADGKPATVTQTVTAPPTPSLCESTSGGTLPFTGSDFILPALIVGMVLIGVGTAMTIVRRRRDEASS